MAEQHATGSGEQPVDTEQPKADGQTTIDPGTINPEKVDPETEDAVVGEGAASQGAAETVEVSVDLGEQPVGAVDEDEAALTLSAESIDPVSIVGPAATSTVTILHASLPATAASAPTGAAAAASSAATASGAPTRETTATAPADDEHGDMYSRRDRIRGDLDERPEPAAMLTADRLLQSRQGKAVPEGFPNNFLYKLTFGALNLGDTSGIRRQKEERVRISMPLAGHARFVPVLTRKGGVGKTTVTTLLGMALASNREDRVIAVDANPDRGTLAERVPKQTRLTVRDIVGQHDSIRSFNDFSSYVSRDDTRLDVIASDSDPLLSEAFNFDDYDKIASLAAQYYSIVLTDCGTGIVHSVMKATLERADSLVVVSGGSVEEARLASETLTWLESNGYGALIPNAVVAINTATQGTNLVRIDEMEKHFLSRVRAVVRIPYDEQLAAGSIVDYASLSKPTRDAAQELAALVVDGLAPENGQA